MNKGFSERLSKAIQALGIKPTHFAYKARVPQGTISKCLNGHVPTARILLRFSKTSGRSVDWLLTGRRRRRRDVRRPGHRPVLEMQAEDRADARGAQKEAISSEGFGNDAGAVLAQLMVGV